jgi:hypothetical protein
MKNTLLELRADYDAQAGRSLAMPCAGAVVWLLIAASGMVLPANIMLYVLLFGSGAIFPLALAFATLLKERIISIDNPLAKLMGLSVAMVNVLWVVHLTVAFRAPEFLPLTVGIGLGLHWMVFSWIIQHPLGIIHTLFRTCLVTAAWLTFPNHRYSAVGLAVFAAYSLSIYQLRTRSLNVAQGKPLMQTAAA